MSKTIEDWHGKKHRTASDEEIELINSLKVPDCPFCGCESFTREGKLSSGIVRCRRSGCGRRFNPLAETIFDSRKIPISERIEYLLHMLEFHSVMTSARDSKNDGKTGTVWLFRLFSVLKGYRDGIVLSGTVWADEAFTPANPAERVALPGGKKPRGLSRNEICVATAVDSAGRAALFPASRGKPSGRRYSPRSEAT